MIKTLCILMFIDMCLGIMLSLLNAEGAKKGRFNSTDLVNGFIKKFAILLIILAYKQVGYYDFICLFFISSEVASITEHAQKFGFFIKERNEKR